MLIEHAFYLMLDSLSAADATREQVRGVLAWRELASLAGAHRQGCGRFPGVDRLVMPATADHTAWTQACTQIIAVLRTWEDEAERQWLEQDLLAGEAEQDRDRWRAQATARRAQAEQNRHLAAQCENPADAGAFLAMADEDDTLAGVADATAADAEQRRQAAQEASDRAHVCRAVTCDAAGFGENLVAAQDARHMPVVTAVADAGAANVAFDRTHYDGRAR